MDPTAAPTAQAQPSAEVLLGRYELARRLGSGGFGTVWLAHDLELDRAVAVKRIPAADASVAARAQREARAVARLQHASIVALHEARTDGDEVVLVSELVRGRTFARLLADGLLSDRDVVRIGRSVCDGLAHAHAKGVVHRDVKPANVLVPDDGTRAKLCDFGVAQVVGDDGLTRTGDVVGTLAYMAPEQAEGRAVGAPADVYALGLCLYEGLSGTNPVRARTPAATVRRVGVRLPPLGRLRRDLPADLCAAIDAAVATHPEQRPSLRDLKRALRAAQDELDDEPGTVEAGPLEPLTRLGRSAGELADPGSVAGVPGALGARLAGRVVGAAGGGGLAAAALWQAGPEALARPEVAGLGAAAAVLLLGRVGWTLAALVVLATLAGTDPGLAGVAALGVVPALVLAWPARVAWWPVPAAAPLLGLAGLAAGAPGLAGLARSAWVRAALGGLGALWLVLAEAHWRTTLLLGPPAGGLDGLASDPRAPGLAAAWALAALVLPLLVRGRALGADLAGAVVWAALLAGGTAAVAGLGAADAPPPASSALLLGPALGAAVAVAGRRGSATRRA